MCCACFYDLLINVICLRTVINDSMFFFTRTVFVPLHKRVVSEKCALFGHSEKKPLSAEVPHDIESVPVFHTPSVFPALSTTVLL